MNFQKSKNFLHFWVNLVTFFFKMTVSSEIVFRTLKMVFQSFFSSKIIFIDFWVIFIFDKLKFWIFENFSRQHCVNNSNVTCATNLKQPKFVWKMILTKDFRLIFSISQAIPCVGNYNHATLTRYFFNSFSSSNFLGNFMAKNFSALFCFDKQFLFT